MPILQFIIHHQQRRERKKENEPSILSLPFLAPTQSFPFAFFAVVDNRSRSLSNCISADEPRVLRSIFG